MVKGLNDFQESETEETMEAKMVSGQRYGISLELLFLVLFTQSKERM